MKTYKIYVAGKWQEKPRIKRFMDYLRERGHTITQDWTIEDNSVAASVADLKGIRRCRILIALMENPHKYKGTYGEIGAALALGKRVIIIGEETTDHIHGFVFAHHPGVTTVQDVETFKLLSLQEWLNFYWKRARVYPGLGIREGGAPVVENNASDCPYKVEPKQEQEPEGAIPITMESSGRGVIFEGVTFE